MPFPHDRPIRSVLIGLATLLAVSFAHASATLLLEEPYGHMGFFTGTGHAAVYLSNICANKDDPRTLRPCAEGETGVVISRYDGVAGYDWLAIPLIPYLYAVDRPEDIPLFADAKMVGFLRDSYRRKHLEEIVPDNADGSAPGGNWYQLTGSSYDRTIYGFEIETTPAQDAALIRKLNGSPNRSHFHLLSRNCADFAKDIINFYYPKALHRSVIADAGITTPKQISKMLVKFNQHHPELAFSRLVIAQVPGSMPRSSNPKGVVESFLKSKKYIVPSAIASPIFAGCVFAVYVGTGAGRFQPDRDAHRLQSWQRPRAAHRQQRSQSLSARAKAVAGRSRSHSNENKSRQDLGAFAVQSENRFRRRQRPHPEDATGRAASPHRCLRGKRIERHCDTATRAANHRRPSAIRTAPRSAQRNLANSARARLESPPANHVPIRAGASNARS